MFPLPAPLDSMPKAERNARLLEIHRKHPRLRFWQLPANMLGAVLASLSFEFCRDQWDAGLFPTMALLMFGWITVTSVVAYRWIYLPKLRKIIADSPAPVF